MAVSKETLSSISAPKQLESRLGTLEFTDGVPSAKTADAVYDQLDFAHGLNAYLNGFLVTKEGIEPLPATGARTLNARTSFFYAYTGITPAMIMRLTGIGSQYVVAFKDGEGDTLDGAKAYRVTLPPDIPATRFWSLTLYDQTRSMLQTPQRFPRAGSQAYPTPAASADADGSTTVTFGPEQPSDSPEGNWIQTTEGKGFFAILRLYSPLPTYFDKTWRPREIEELT